MASHPALVGRNAPPVRVEQLLRLSTADEIAHVPGDAAVINIVVGQGDDGADADLSPGIVGSALCPSLEDCEACDVSSAQLSTVLSISLRYAQFASHPIGSPIPCPRLE